MKRTPEDIREKKVRAAKKANDAIRRDWGDISPVTKVIPNKKKQAKEAPKYPSYVEII